MSPRSSALLLLLVGAAVRLPAQTLATADSLLALRDTSGAIAALEALIKHDRKNAEAHYRVGVLYMSRHVPGSALSPNRRKAEDHFRYATRFQSDSAKYWLALAEAFRTEEVTTTRLQVTGMVQRASEELRKHGGDTLGFVDYRIGRVEWDRYEQFAHRYLFPPSEGGGDQPDMPLSFDALMGDWTFVREFVEQGPRPDPANPGEANLTTAEIGLRNALEKNPRFVAAAGLLAVVLGEGDRWAEAYPIAREVVVAAPDSGGAHAVLGLVLARLNRWREAQTEFDRALERMAPEQRAPYDNIGFILRMADSIKLANQAPDTRTLTDSLYWLTNQPLYLHQVNEQRVEFFARLTYVIHRWSDPLRGYQGYESDRGAVYVRYGPPDVWETLGPMTSTIVPMDAAAALDRGRITVLWVYLPTRIRFSFSLAPGYARARFSGNLRASYEEVRNTVPVRFDNVPVMRTLDTIGTQVAQFRGATPDLNDVVVFAATPTGRMEGASSVAGLQLVTAAIVKDRTLRDVARERREQIVTTGDTLRLDMSTWRLSLPPRDYRLRVEATLDALGRAARGAVPLDVRRFTRDSLQLSDVVAAARIVPKDSNAARWTDFLVEPSAGRLPPGAPVSLLWETYNLTPDSAGVVDYQVDVRFTVQEIERHGFAAELLGRIGDVTGLSAKGDDQVTLSFHRRREAPADGRAVEYLDVDLQNAPEASYLLTVTVTDTHTGRAASVDRWFTVSALPLKR